MIKNYSALGERMEMRTLENGLRVCYLPKMCIRDRWCLSSA